MKEVLRICDAAAQPCFANGRALRIVAQADGLMLGPSGLSAASPAATQRLRQAVAVTVARDGMAALSGTAAEPNPRLRLERPSRRPPLLLSFFPLRRLGASIAAIPTPRVAIFVNEPDDCPPIDRDAIADAFHLTPREAAIAALLAGGHGLKGTAQALGIGIGTVRYHVKHVLQKTSTRTQATLVAALRGFVGTRQE